MWGEREGGLAVERGRAAPARRKRMSDIDVERERHRRVKHGSGGRRSRRQPQMKGVISKMQVKSLVSLIAMIIQLVTLQFHV